LDNQVHHNIVHFFVAPIVAATIAIVGWSLFNVVELKEDVATIKADVKLISKQVDRLNVKIA
jgi:hypothetical protein